jgi:hypothetical protein
LAQGVTMPDEFEPNETFHQRLKRLSQQGTPNGELFVKGSSLGPITFTSATFPGDSNDALSDEGEDRRPEKS